MKNLIAKYAVSALLTATSINLVYAADYSVGGTAGTLGLGGTFSMDTHYQLFTDDQLQFRVVASGFAFDDIDDVEISGTDYEGDYETNSLQGGLAWYPMSSKYTDRFFVSTGLIYFNNEFEGKSERNQANSIGNFNVGRNDDTRLNTDIEHESFAPYISLGWGDRIREVNGISFRAEVGVFMPISDADVELSVSGNVNNVPAADLAKERRDIEDDLEGALGYAMMAVTYQF